MLCPPPEGVAEEREREKELRPSHLGDAHHGGFFFFSVRFDKSLGKRAGARGSN